MKRKKRYGSAVFTALQSMYMNIEYILREARHRSIQSFLRGGRMEDWWDEYWRNCALLQAQKIKRNAEKKCNEISRHN